MFKKEKNWIWEFNAENRKGVWEGATISSPCFQMSAGIVLQGDAPLTYTWLPSGTIYVQETGKKNLILFFLFTQFLV